MVALHQKPCESVAKKKGSQFADRAFRNESLEEAQ
jgi:hypothetical protein